MGREALGGIALQIIVVSNRLSKARAIEVRWWHALVLLFAGAIGVMGLSSLISYVGVRHAADIKLPLLQSMIRSATDEQAQAQHDFLRDNLNAMAVRLGQMQAQLLRLDALGERLSGAAGVKPQDFRFGEPPGRGGAQSSALPPRDLSLGEFGQLLEAVSRDMETRTDYLGVLESRLQEQRVRQRLLPTALPVLVGSWNASGFGWRLDPITGQSAIHEGIDFIAPPGSPILAAAAGIVAAAEFHPTYGNMIDVNHGHDLITRYAHASKMLVKPGELVKRGQKIAEVGNTGRSTGAHLHFEVRSSGVPLNPTRFLQAASASPAATAAAPRAAASK
jgi:murein DD-endopeptidase MepM/ murein hydrolase activator NlpD